MRAALDSLSQSTQSISKVMCILQLHLWIPGQNAYFLSVLTSSPDEEQREKRDWKQKERSFYDGGVKELGGEMGPELLRLVVECKWRNLSRMFPPGGSRGRTAAIGELPDYSPGCLCV